MHCEFRNVVEKICGLRYKDCNEISDLSNLALETDVSPTRGTERSRTPGERKSIGPEQLRPLPESLIFDIRNVQAMTDIKTHIGYARAWVRLALEKKLLSRHLKTLLGDTGLLRYIPKIKASNEPENK